MLPVECIVRGYITGSGWKDYLATGKVSGLALPEGLPESEQLPEPLYTPSTKAEVGHDEAIDFEQTVELIGDRALAERLRDVTIAVYQRVADHARERGVILADTKLEFGLDDGGNLVLGDEVCTPDSSRFWPADAYAARPRPAELRQAVRARLGVGHGLGQVAAGAGHPRRRRRRHARALRRGLREADRRAVRRVGGRDARPGPDPPQGGHPRPAGPDGRARAAGARLRGRDNVHVGRLVELDIEDPSRLPAMCEQLLANPLIEDYEIVE